MMDSSILLTYQSSTIRGQDLLSLQPYQWLTDEAITFYLEYLEHSYKFPFDSQVLAICPSVAATLCLSDAEEHQDLSKQFAHLSLSNKRLFICPINNGDGLTVGSGQHWALLVGLKQSQLSQLKFFYLDSMGGTSCYYQAKKLCSALSALALNNASLWDSDISFECVKGVPKQQNAYDCGIYTLIMAQRILLNKEEVLQGCQEKDLKQAVGEIGSAKASDFRKELRSILENQIKAKQK